MSISLPARLHSVFLKLAFIIVGAILVTVLSLSLLTVSRLQHVVDETLNQQALSETLLVAKPLAGPTRFGKTDAIMEQLQELAESSGGALVDSAVINTEGDALAYGTAPPDQAARDIAQEALTRGEVVQDKVGMKTAVPLRFGQDNAIIGAFVANWTDEHLRAEFRSILVNALAVAAFVSFLAVCVATLAIQRLAARPLRAMQDDIARLRTKDFEHEPEGVHRKDEFGQVAIALDALRHDLAGAEEVNRQSAFKSSALDQTSVALMILDADFTITQISPKLVALFDMHHVGLKKLRPVFDREKVVGMNLRDFHGDPAMLQKMRDLGSDSLEGMVKLDDSRITITTTAVHDAGGAVAGYVVEWCDVTALWRQQALLDTIDHIQIKAEFAMSGECTEANDRFKQCLSIDDTGRVRLHDLIAPIAAETGASVGALLEGLQSGRPHIGHLKLVAEGQTRIIDGSLSCIRDRDGTGLRFLLLGADITEQEAEIEAARAEREVSEQQKSEVVEALGVGLRQLSDGDLTATISQTFPGRYETLRNDFNATAQKLARAMREISESAENIRNESGDITNTADSLSRRTESTAATLEQTAAALDELTSALKSAAQGAAKADSVVGEAHRKAEASGEVVIETVSAMDLIAKSSEQITSIIRVIDDIAFQTNLLALNAGVEAARAGEAGRGFAVVASEVRALAQRSSEAAREINGLIADSGGQVKKGVELVGQTGQALRDIVTSVTEIAGLVSEIAGSSHSQSLSLEEINESVNKLDQSTQQNAARLEETTAASEALRNDAISLVKTISHFKTGGASRSKPAAPTGTPKVAAVGGSAAPAMAAPEGEAAKWMDF